MISDRPFVDRPVGDLVAAGRVAHTIAAQLELPAPALVRSGMNALYRAGDAMIRVGRPSAAAEHALTLANVLTNLGVPVAQPYSSDVVTTEDGLSATAWRAIEAVGAPIDWRAVGDAVRRVHELDPAVLPPAYPLPSPASFPWWNFEALLADVGHEIDPIARAGLESAIAAGSGWDRFESVVVCHGDVHPGNVLMTDAGPVLLDWDLMCVAAPGWDHAMLLTLAERWGGDPDVYPAFATGYGQSLADDPATQRLAHLRNVAATLMRVRAGRTDPEAAQEAARRLRYWRGDRDAPTWQAQ